MGKGQRNVLAASRGIVAAALLLLAASVSLLSWSKTNLRARHAQYNRAHHEAPLYLPEAKYVRLVTLGFDGFLSDILWFNTVNYFGKQYLGQKDYQWLFHMCTLVTRLDPNALHVYEFCGSLLSWIAKQPDRSNRILSEAIEHHPLNWRFYYLRGFNYWYFMENLERAKEDLLRASRVPGAPTFLASLASRLVAATENPHTAINFLKDLIDNAEDPTVQKALGEKLKLAYVSRDTERLERLAAEYRERSGKPAASLDDLVAAGVLKFIPSDPFGDQYRLDPATGHVISESARRGLSFEGKTARTGLLKGEFRD